MQSITNISIIYVGGATVIVVIIIIAAAVYCREQLTLEFSSCRQDNGI